MRAEIYRPEDPETVLATARWSDGRMSLEVTEPGRELEGWDALLRPTPVVVEGASLRRLGTHGETLLEPGSYDWFRSTLRSRVDAMGLAVRFVAEAIVGGWDPAAAYRSFGEQVDRLVSS
jgi:hypothetical protein